MASIGDINNLQDKENLDIGLVPTHYFDAQGNKRNIAEDVAAIYQAINGKADSSQVGQAIGQLTQAVNSKADASHTHGTGDITGLDNTLNGLGSSIGNINASLEHKADESHTHDTLVDHNSASAVVALSWAGSAVSSVTPDGSNTRSSSKYLVAVYLDNGTPVFKDVDVGNVKVGDSLNADKVDGYHILVNQTVTARTDAIFFL
jgi:hypothetical protein